MFDMKDPTLDMEMDGECDELPAIDVCVNCSHWT